MDTGFIKKLDSASIILFAAASVSLTWAPALLPIWLLIGAVTTCTFIMGRIAVYLSGRRSRRQKASASSYGLMLSLPLTLMLHKNYSPQQRVSGKDSISPYELAEAF